VSLPCAKIWARGASCRRRSHRAQHRRDAMGTARKPPPPCHPATPPRAKLHRPQPLPHPHPNTTEAPTSWHEAGTADDNAPPTVPETTPAQRLWHGHHTIGPLRPCRAARTTPSVGTPTPANHTENASSLEEHTFPPPPTGVGTTAPAGPNVMVGAFGVRNSAVTPTGWRGRPRSSRTPNSTGGDSRLSLGWDDPCESDKPPQASLRLGCYTAAPGHTSCHDGTGPAATGGFGLGGVRR